MKKFNNWICSSHYGAGVVGLVMWSVYVVLHVVVKGNEFRPI
jgi:hypothetical protein